MQTLAGSVSAFFALENFDRRRGVATYVLRVVNRTNAVLVCRTWVVSRAGDTLLAYPVLFEVEPLSTGTTRVPVWPADFPSFERAIAEVAGDGVHCIVEAPAPPRVPPQRRYAAGGAVLAGFLALAVAAGGWFAAVPRIGAFAVPPEALAGTTVQAEYGVSGSGHLKYAVTAPDGKMLQAGDLGERSGSIPIAIPAVDTPGAYAIRMQLTGPLGTASETRILDGHSAARKEHRADSSGLGKAGGGKAGRDYFRCLRRRRRRRLRAPARNRRNRLGAASLLA